MIRVRLRKPRFPIRCRVHRLRYLRDWIVEARSFSFPGVKAYSRQHEHAEKELF